MLLQRWESMQGCCEASGASRDCFTSGDSPTQLPLTLGGGGAVRESAPPTPPTEVSQRQACWGPQGGSPTQFWLD